MENPLNPYAAPSTTDTYLAPQPNFELTESLRQVASGLGLVRLSVIIIFLAAVVFVILAIALRQQLGGQMQMLMLGFVGVLLAAQILSLIGKFRCVTAPPESNARPLALTSLVLDLVNLVLGIVGWSLAAPANQYTGSGSELLGCISIVAFVLFVRKIGFFLGRPDIVSRRKFVGYLRSVVCPTDGDFFHSFAAWAGNDGWTGAVRWTRLLRS